MQKKFSEVVPISTPSDTDLFLLADVSESASKRITAIDLKSYIVDNQVFSDNANSIISALNAYDDGSGTNGLTASVALNANNLDGESPSFYLEYSNFANTPGDLSSFTNTTGFLRYDDNVAPARIVYEETGQSTPITITTNFVREGTNNLYYTDARVEDFFDSNFATYYNQFSTAFDEGNIRDSLTGEDATFINVNANQSNVIRLTNTSVFDSFSNNQILRVYGASVDLENEISSVSTTWAVNANGFRTSGNDLIDFSYKICEFNMETGDISPASAEKTVSIGVPSELANTVSSNTAVDEVFSVDYFISLTISSVPEDTGILIYRQGPGDANHKLYAVLGTKEVNSGIYIDYYNFDYTTWSGKSATTNTYTSIVHFPLTAPNTVRKGWTDRTITNIVRTSTTIDLTLDTSVYVNASQTCQIVHNDTSKIQSAINNNSASGRRSVTLNAKTYVSGEILVPNNFSIVGSPYITKIHRLPWSGYSPGNETSAIIKSTQNQGAENISLVGFDIEGNARNQFLLNDFTDRDVNYAINFGIESDSILLDKVRMRNVIAGGIYATQSQNFRKVNSETRNSGVTDRFVYSPLIVDAGQNTKITENVFENYTDYIDVSVTSTGTITNNIIRNCGSGLLVYGSTFLLSSPNVLIGPAGEFLPTPDTLNSEYDSVNIDLTEKFLANTDFVSSVFLYQENGLPYDISASEGSLIYDTYFLQKLSNGVEEIYSSNTGITINNVTANTDPTVGQFKFSIPREDVQDIKLSDGAYSYSTLANTNPDHVGIAWSATCRQIVDDCTYTGGSANGDIYTITATGLQYAGINSEVRLNDDGAFSTGGASEIGNVTEVARPNPNQDIYTVKIQFPGATITPGTGGTLQYVDKFVLAQGRIL